MVAEDDDDDGNFLDMVPFLLHFGIINRFYRSNWIRYITCSNDFRHDKLWSTISIRSIATLVESLRRKLKEDCFQDQVDKNDIEFSLSKFVDLHCCLDVVFHFTSCFIRRP